MSCSAISSGASLAESACSTGTGRPSRPVRPALPNSWFADVVRWLPGGEALSPIARSGPPLSPHLFGAWGEFAVFSGYAVVLLALGAWAFIRRDA